jgi:hypothetical protein
MELPDDTLVFPSHDYKGRQASTIGRERAQNARVRIESPEAFIDVMNRLGLPEPERMAEVLSANKECR